MPKCLVCKSKFEPTYFLQKHCSNKECERDFKKNISTTPKIYEYKPKKKECKGVGQTNGYGCGSLVLERRYGLGLSCCFNNWLTSSEKGKELQEKSKIPNKSEKEPLNIKDIVEVNKKQNVIEQTIFIVHTFIKLRDFGKSCVSCGKSYHSTFQAGHFYKAELYSGLRFDERNIHGQCIECNIYKDSNFEEYKKRISLRLSEKDFIILEEESKFNKQYKWTIDELMEIQKHFKHKIRELKDGRVEK